MASPPSSTEASLPISRALKSSSFQMDIDTNQRDVFETEDMPEFQPMVYIERTPDHLKENIETTNTSLNDALQKFASQSLDTSKQDYSQSIVAARRRRQQIQQNQAEFEVLPSDDVAQKKETPLQKFTRLQLEITSFMEELESKKNEKGDNETEKTLVSPAQMAQELALLNKQLHGLQNDDKLASWLNPKYDVQSAAQQQDSLSEKLIHQLKNVLNSQQQGSTTTSSTTESSSSSNNNNTAASSSNSNNNSLVTYELFFSGEHSKNNQLARAADLEKRLAAIEHALGDSHAYPGLVSISGGSTNNPNANKGLLNVVSQLKERLTVLSEPANIEAVQKNLKVINQEIDRTIEKRQAITGTTAGQEKKVNELYDLITKWDVVAQQLPALVSRLQSLRSLHEQSASFVETVQQLEDQQGELKKLLKNNEQLMGTLEQNFSTNFTVIQSNVTALEKRYDDLKKKLEVMGLETF